MKGRESKCWRIMYRSLERNLTNAEVFTSISINCSVMVLISFCETYLKRKIIPNYVIQIYW